MGTAGSQFSIVDDEEVVGGFGKVGPARLYTATLDEGSLGVWTSDWFWSCIAKICTRRYYGVAMEDVPPPLPPPSLTPYIPYLSYNVLFSSFVKIS